MAQVLVLSYGEWPGIPVPLPRKCILRWCRWVHGQHCFFFFFFFKLYVWVCGLHICMCMCVPGVCSLQGQKLLCTSCCCVPLAGSLTYSTELLLHYSLPFLSAPQTCTPSHHYWFLVSCSLCAVRHTLPSYPSSILQSCRRKAREQLWPGKQQDRKWLEWRKMLSAHL